MIIGLYLDSKEFITKHVSIERVTTIQQLQSIVFCFMVIPFTDKTHDTSFHNSHANANDIFSFQ